MPHYSGRSSKRSVERRASLVSVPPRWVGDIPTWRRRSIALTGQRKPAPHCSNLSSWVPDWWYQKQFNKPYIPGAFYQAGTADNTVTKDFRPVYRGNGISSLDLIEVSMSRIDVVSNILSSPFPMLDPQTANLENPSFRGNLALFCNKRSV